MKKALVTLAVLALTATLAAGGLAAVRKEGTYKLSAKLTAAREVPKPKGVPAAATGTFTGTLKGKVAFSGEPPVPKKVDFTKTDTKADIPVCEAGSADEKQEIPAGQLTVHADRGTAMTAKSVALLLADLGVTRTHSRPHVSDDNPYSEAQFKTLKYHPTFPERFGSVQDARSFCQGFFPWYNTEHRHDALGLLTPEVVHYGHVDAILEQRRAVLAAAYAAHPERFVRKPPEPLAPPTAAWINPPAPSAVANHAVGYAASPLTHPTKQTSRTRAPRARRPAA